LLNTLKEELPILADCRAPPCGEGTYRLCGTRRGSWDLW